MSSKYSDTVPELSDTNVTTLNVLGDECARTILIVASNNPSTAKELTAYTNCSSATVYRRINDLLEAELLRECIRFEDNGSHTTAYETIIERLQIEISTGGVDISKRRRDDSPGE